MPVPEWNTEILEELFDLFRLLPRQMKLVSGVPVPEFEWSVQRSDVQLIPHLIIGACGRFGRRERTDCDFRYRNTLRRAADAELTVLLHTEHDRERVVEFEP